MSGTIFERQSRLQFQGLSSNSPGSLCAEQGISLAPANSEVAGGFFVRGSISERQLTEMRDGYKSFVDGNSGRTVNLQPERAST
jgi:hypothetical protein